MDINAAIDSVVETDAEGVIVPLVDREGEPYLQPNGKPVTMTVLGEESPAMKRFDDRLARRLSRGKQAEDDKAQNLIARMATAVTAWDGVDDENGKPLPFTLDNVKHVLRASWILMTVYHATRERSDFFGSSSTD